MNTKQKINAIESHRNACDHNDCFLFHFTCFQWNNLAKLSYEVFINGYYRKYCMCCWWPTHQHHKVTSHLNNYSNDPSTVHSTSEAESCYRQTDLQFTGRGILVSEFSHLINKQTILLLTKFHNLIPKSTKVLGSPSLSRSTDERKFEKLLGNSVVDFLPGIIEMCLMMQSHRKYKHKSMHVI